MALKLSLKPNERLVINGAVLQNGDRRTVLMIQNHASVLREKDILLPEDVTTPARRIYFAIMMLYLEGDDDPKYQDEFVDRMTEFMHAISSAQAVVQCVEIVQMVQAKRYYTALNMCRELYPFEEERLNYVPADLPDDAERD